MRTRADCWRVRKAGRAGIRKDKARRRTRWRGEILYLWPRLTFHAARIYTRRGEASTSTRFLVRTLGMCITYALPSDARSPTRSRRSPLLLHFSEIRDGQALF